MKAFLVTMLFMYSTSVVLNLYDLGWKDYPLKPDTRSSSAARVLVAAVFAAWVLFLLVRK
jgi:hypothetical protein